MTEERFIEITEKATDMTADEIEKEAEKYVDMKFSLKIPSAQLADDHPVESTVGENKNFCKGDWIAGYKAAQEEYELDAENYRKLDKLVGRMYINGGSEMDDIGDLVVTIMGYHD